MSDVVIRVENLSKQYRIGAHEGYKTFRETLVDTVKVPFQRLSSLLSAPCSKLSSTNDTIWALKDVSFEVKQGEVVGIIGRNGAGKSTLLKILSKITEPTEGRVELKGRIGSLLEVGTGFHPELTGHENVYLYGAILGMDRWEVTRKFDEIIAFAEIAKFIDTPVKRYSSGMYMRLAFAVAAHMETEILLVDEVLAVGDTQFQKKCLGKMGDVARKGRTVLFVSHNMAAIRNLCPNTILLNDGKIVAFDDTKSVISSYLIEGEDLCKQAISKRKDRTGNGEIRFTEVWIEDSSGNLLKDVMSGQNIRICFKLKRYGRHKLSKIIPSFVIHDINGYELTLHRSNYTNQEFTIKHDEGILYFDIPHLPLSLGKYKIGINLMQGNDVLDNLGDAFSFRVITGDFFNTGVEPIIGRSPILLEGHWGIR
jgi:lipopolysaccharide transport system ATP-binding protein